MAVKLELREKDYQELKQYFLDRRDQLQKELIGLDFILEQIKEIEQGKEYAINKKISYENNKIL
jgi:hypothetical protein